jgi:RNA polymerase sigma-70 factor, ECF subfamily
MAGEFPYVSSDAETPMLECGGRLGPSMEPAGEITQLLHAWSAGDRGVEERLFSLVLPELLKMARALMRRERRDHTLEPSALMNQAYVRLLAGRERDWESRRHFFAVSARIMRRLLIDHARARTKLDVVPLESSRDTPLGRGGAELEIAIAVDSVLDELQSHHPDWCLIVELKYFMGLTDEETAGVLGLHLRTMQRQFSDARRWLMERLYPSSCETKANATKL